MSFYSTADEVILYTGLKKETLGIATDAALKTQVETWLTQIKDFIDRDRRKDFSALSSVPPVVSNVALRMCANMVRAAVRNRTRSVVQVDADEGETPLDDVKIFTEAIRKDLMRIPRVSAIEFAVAGEDDDDEEAEE